MRIENDMMPGAYSIKRYRNLVDRRDTIKREQLYSDWFEQNKTGIKHFLKEIFNTLIKTNKDFVFAKYDKEFNTISFKDDTLNYEYMKMVLNRYGYFLKFINSENSEMGIEIIPKFTE